MNQTLAPLPEPTSRPDMRGQSTIFDALGWVPPVTRTTDTDDQPTQMDLFTDA